MLSFNIRLGLAVLALASEVQMSADALAANVVIVANARQPESMALARFYAGQRGIPAANIIALPMPEEETITWRQFIDQVYQPLQDELCRQHWITGTTSSLLDGLGRPRFAFTSQHISYLVVCRGVPLRVANDPTLLSPADDGKTPGQFRKNEGAVDAELSLLALGNYEINGLIGNPLFARADVKTLDGAQVVKVSRLDGPTWADARHLVTAALAGERIGLIGRYYLDLKGPHAMGDEWLVSVQEQLQGLGFDGDREETAGVFGPGARFDAPVFYFGWYTDNLNGPFLREGFRFPPGAVAVHIHSFSAQTLHSDTIGWSGPLVARGVAATVGNVFEPYLEFTHRPDLLLRALSQGRNFGDAVYFALPALSWQEIAIGDPLYRPFQVSVTEQLMQGRRLTSGELAYVWLRQANLLSQKGQEAAQARALSSAQREAKAAGNAVLVEETSKRLAQERGR